MRTKLLFVVAIAAVSAVLVPVASADKPSKEPAAFPPGLTGQFCADFMVQVDLVVNEEFTITFGSGRAIVAGRLILEVINLDTGESVTVNVSGPVFFDASGESVVLRGNSLLFAEAGDFWTRHSRDSRRNVGCRYLPERRAWLHPPRHEPRPLRRVGGGIGQRERRAGRKSAREDTPDAPRDPWKEMCGFCVSGTTR